MSSGNHHNFSGTLKVQCSAGTAYSEDLTKKVSVDHLSVRYNSDHNAGVWVPLSNSCACTLPLDPSSIQAVY